MNRIVESLVAATLISLATVSSTFSQESSFEIPIRGIVRASLEATLATRIVAPINYIGFREGQQFKKGDVLVELDCRPEEAELAAAKATHREKLITFESAEYLFKQNAGNRQELETARAQADRAKAQVDSIEARLEGCRIVAPFDGRVSKLSVHKFEMPAAGSPLISIVDSRAPEIELIVPSTWLKKIKPGTKFGFVVDETREQHLGIVKRTGATVDAVSQTIKVFAAFSKSVSTVMPGMSGTASF